MVKILTLTDSLSVLAGGLANVTFNMSLKIANNWPESEQIILCQKDSYEMDASISLPANMRVIKVGGVRNAVYPWARFLFKEAETIKPDLIHLRGLWRQTSLACLALKDKYPDVPLVIQPAGMLEPWPLSKNKFKKSIHYSLFEKNLLNLCDCIHATSSMEVDSLISLGIDSSKIINISEGITIPDASIVTNRLECDPRRLLFLSRIDPKKGINLLLDAVSQLRPRNWVIDIAGGCSDIHYMNQLLRSIDRLDLSSLINILGPLTGFAKDNAFQSAHAFVLPSYSENFGIAIAEAMSWGLPVLTTTGTPWSVVANDNLGWYVNAEINTVTHALYELLQSPQSSLNEKGSRARSYVSDHFSWDIVSNKMINIYQSLIGRSAMQRL